MSAVLRLTAMAGVVLLSILIIITIMAIFGERLDHDWSNPPT
jgi:hypothetical protein